MSDMRWDGKESTVFKGMLYLNEDSQLCKLVGTLYGGVHFIGKLVDIPTGELELDNSHVNDCKPLRYDY